MNISVSKNVLADPERGILRCGYAKLYNRQTRETSFVRRLHGDMYPRFHAYIREEAQSWVVSLHIDQKRPSYEGSAAHAGEYDGQTVSLEAERIQNTIAGSTKSAVE